MSVRYLTEGEFSEIETEPFEIEEEGVYGSFFSNPYEISKMKIH